MDRTEASDAFNAGSIPVGCIFCFDEKGVFMDKTNWKEKAGQLKQKMQSQVLRLIQMCKENKKVIAIIGVFLVVIVASFVVLGITEKKQEMEAIAEIETKAADTDAIVVPEEALEKDAYPEVNNLVKEYYQALVDGDMETIHRIKNVVNEEEELKLVKKSEFIEGYPNLIVYTKKGPEEGSYVAYVQYEVKFMNIEKTAPGLNTLYICVNEEGSYYINANVLDEKIVEYLKSISVQNDVVDLFNTVQVAYNDVKAQDEDLSAFLDELPNLLAEAVSEAITEQEAAEAALNPEPETEDEEEVVLVVTKVKTTDVVNVRSSDSVEADKIGKTSKGQVLELIEERVNGWSKVNFEGKEGYIKTEFLEAEETEMQLSSEVPENAKTESVTEIDNSTKKKAKLTDSVKVRKTPSTDADIVGTLTKGTEIEVLEQMNNGWTKINHINGESYVKSEFVTILGEMTKEDEQDSSKDASTMQKATLTDNVNVRKMPSTDATIVGLLSKGTEIEVIEKRNDGWTKINHPNGEAYVKSDYVKY